jgi:uncharacterized protein
MDKNLLAVFAKQPLPGRVKTRLAAATSPEFAARLAEAMLRDTLGKMAKIAAERVIVYAPASAEGYFRALAGSAFAFVPQAEGDLGARLASFVNEHGAGRRVVLLGADSPTLPCDHVQQAFASLATADVVIGPATDGGYYLLGLSKPAALFDGIDWSGPHVLAQTCARIQSLDLRLHMLPPWYDIDTAEDVRFVAGHFAAAALAGVDLAAPRTQAAVQEFA